MKAVQNIALGAYGAARQRVLEILLEAQVRMGAVYLRLHPETPSLYASGMKYSKERGEQWHDIPTALRRGRDDCEGLATWRAAELRVRHGVHARAVLRRITKTLWHVVVKYPNGATEDPSKKLGMKGSA